MTFDPRTATRAEFEAEARRLHARRVEYIDNLTDEEKKACDRFMMPGYLERARELRLNEAGYDAAHVRMQVDECVRHWRTDQWQSSDEYMDTFRTAREHKDFRAVMEAARVEYYRRFESRDAPEPASVHDRIVAAIPPLEDRDYTRSGKPRVKALRDATGEKVTGRQRDAAWSEIANRSDART